MKILRLLIIAFMTMTAILQAAATEPADDLSPLRQSTDTLSLLQRAREAATEGYADSLPPLAGSNWMSRLINSGFHINDPRIGYPRFPRFVLNVYNLGNYIFNHYDSTYVVGTGKNWKLQFKNDLWMRTYIMELADRSSIHITSRLYDDIGIHLSFMAVSVGYTFNVNKYVGNHSPRHRFDLNFTCSRFAFNYWYQKVEGGTKIRQLGNYGDGRWLDYKFNDINVADSHLELYYLINNQRYSQAAAYCFSKYQLTSAGSWIVGVSYDRHNMNIDFSSLPPDMLAALPSLQTRYQMKYTDYCLLGGYAYNWVLKPRKWLVNVTALPFIGYKHTSTDNQTDRKIRDMISTNVGMMGSIVYNHKSLFASLEGRFTGFVNYSTDYTFFYSTQLMTLVVGTRF